MAQVLWLYSILWMPLLVLLLVMRAGSSEDGASTKPLARPGAGHAMPKPSPHPASPSRHSDMDALYDSISELGRSASSHQGVSPSRRAAGETVMSVAARLVQVA